MSHLILTQNLQLPRKQAEWLSNFPRVTQLGGGGAESGGPVLLWVLHHQLPSHGDWNLEKDASLSPLANNILWAQSHHFLPESFLSLEAAHAWRDVESRPSAEGPLPSPQSPPPPLLPAPSVCIL